MSAAPERGSLRRGLGWALLIFLLCDLVLLLPGLIEHGVHVVPGSGVHDAGIQFVPWRAYAREALLAGRLPEWNPHLFLGVPFIASLQSAVFYPPNLAAVALPTGLGMWLGRLLHLLLAQVGAWLLVRRLGGSDLGGLLAGAAFGLGAQFVDRIFAGHVCQLDAQAWIPWIALAGLACVRGRMRVGLLAGAFGSGLQLMAGYPQIVQVTWFGLIVLLPALAWSEGLSARQAARRIVLFVVFVPAAAAALAAVTLLPAFELLGLSARAGFDPEWVGMLSMPPDHLTSAIAPGLRGRTAGELPYWGQGYPWETTVFVGAVTLVVAAWGARGRRALPWVVAGAWLLFLAFGRYNPAFLPIAEHVPGLGIFRGPTKYLVPLTLCLAVLGGLGLERALQGGWRGPLTGVTVCALALLPLLVLADPGAWNAAWEKHVVDEAARNEFRRVSTYGTFPARAWSEARVALGLGLVVLAASMGLLAAARAGRLPRRQGVRGLVVLALVELLASGHVRAKFFHVDGGPFPDALVERVREVDPQPARVGLIGPPRSWNQGMLLGLDGLSGYEAILPARTNAFYNAALGDVDAFGPPAPGERRFLRLIGAPNRFTALLNMRYMATGGSFGPPPRTEIGFDVHPEDEPNRYRAVRVYRDPRAQPRAFLVHRSEVVSDRDALLQRLTDPAFDPADVVLLEREAPPPVEARSPPASLDTVEVLRRRPEEAQLEVYATAPALLLVSEAHYPGWTATVNGASAPILHAHGALRAVPVPAGRSRVEFRFRSTSVRVGLTVSALSWLALLGLAFALRRRISASGRG